MTIDLEPFFVTTGPHSLTPRYYRQRVKRFLQPQRNDEGNFKHIKECLKCGC